jgi:hypothetical protein
MIAGQTRMSSGVRIGVLAAKQAFQNDPASPVP